MSLSKIRRLWLLGLLGCLPLPIAAQDTPAITFTFDFPGSQPEHYAIAVSSDGHASYESNGKLSQDSEDSDPFHLDFAVSQPRRARMFELAKRAHYFEDDIDSGKRGLASTGVKTLAYKGGGKSTQAMYNYSPLSAVQELTQIFQNLSSTLEFGRRLEYYHRYQKLALDDEMKRMEEMAKENSLEQLSAVAPVLRQIANDASVIKVVRARAQRLLELAGAQSGH
jgi:hypothetical protein